jgi:hypothetical protein
MFFFEKKIQKTFIPYRRLTGNPRQSDQKFIASFLQKRRPSMPLPTIASWRSPSGPARNVVVDPFGHQCAGLAQARLRMMDPVERGAALKSRQVVRASAAQFAIGGDHRAFASPPVFDHTASPVENSS